MFDTAKLRTQRPQRSACNNNKCSRISPQSLAPAANNNAKSIGLTFSRGWLVHIAKETVEISQQGHYTNRLGRTVSVEEALKNSLQNSAHYHSSHEFHPEQTTTAQFDQTEFHVCYGSSLQVAKRLGQELQKLNHSPSTSRAQNQIGILNSASGKWPEKFLRGTLSQEEGICRASLLYPCLLQYYNRPHHFYYVNHKPKYADSTSSCAIFSPHVPVIREDSMKGYLLDDYETYSFVSIPAPNAFALGKSAPKPKAAAAPSSPTSVTATGIMEDDESSREEHPVPKAQQPGSSGPYETMTIQSAMHDRIFRALSIFAEQGCTDLVLCAFGCGVHGNDPHQIATCFREVLASDPLAGRFRTVVFAIHPSRHENYKQFAQVFAAE